MTPAPERQVDIRHLGCPMTWVRTRVALDALASGQVLEVLLLEGEPLDSVPRTAQEEGHAIALRERLPGDGPATWRLLIVKGSDRVCGGLLP